jgi:hypothetical protein
LLEDFSDVDAGVPAFQGAGVQGGEDGVRQAGQPVAGQEEEGGQAGLDGVLGFLSTKREGGK